MATVESDRPALLVLRDAFAGGWTATVDGEQAPLLRAYGSMKALLLPAGAHEVVVRYEAPGLMAGFGLSAASWALWLLLWLRGRRRIGPSLAYASGERG